MENNPTIKGGVEDDTNKQRHRNNQLRITNNLRRSNGNIPRHCVPNGDIT